jgi:hypothetical protein
MTAGKLKELLANINDDLEVTLWSDSGFPQPVRTLSLIEGPVGNQYSYETTRAILLDDIDGYSPEFKSQYHVEAVAHVD